MRISSTLFDAEVAGTSSGDRLIAQAWRAGKPVSDELDIIDFSISWSAADNVAIQGQATLEIADPDGDLAPWAPADSLGPGGSRLHLAWVSGLSGVRIPLGIWLIRRTRAREAWRSHTYPGGRTVRLPLGGTLTVEADEDPWASIATQRLDSDPLPDFGSAHFLLSRALVNICAVSIAGVPDHMAGTAFTFSTDRSAAVREILGRLQAVARAMPCGTLEVLPLTPRPPVWTLAGGNEGVLVNLERELSDTNLFNSVTVESLAAPGLVNRQYIEHGDLAWGGPFGRRPLFVRSLGETPAQVEHDAHSALAAHSATGDTDIPVTCLAHPGIQLHDFVTVMAPSARGDESLVGRVVGMRLSSASGTPSKTMELVVRVPSAALQAISEGLRE